MYYQCIDQNGIEETEEEALKIYDDAVFYDVFDFHKNKEIELIKFIIRLKVPADKCVSSLEGLIKFDELVTDQTAQTVLELVDEAAAKEMQQLN